MEEDIEQDRIQRQVTRGQKRKKLVHVETFNKEEDDYLTPSIKGTEKISRVENKQSHVEAVVEEYNDDLSPINEAAVKDDRAHLQQRKDKNYQTIYRVHVCIVCGFFIRSCEAV